MTMKKQVKNIFAGLYDIFIDGDLIDSSNINKFDLIYLFEDDDAFYYKIPERKMFISHNKKTGVCDWYEVRNFKLHGSKIVEFTEDERFTYDWVDDDWDYKNDDWNLLKKRKEKLEKLKNDNTSIY
jgi:hypothetical protein